MNFTIIILSVLLLVAAVVIIVLNQKYQKAKAVLITNAGETRPLRVADDVAATLEVKLTQAYEVKINEATNKFGSDLSDTSTRLSEQVSRLTTSVIEQELESYHNTLEEVRHTASVAMDNIRAAVEEQRVELRRSMEADLAADKARLAAKFDTKMGDIVSSYISESLGNGADLGAQMQYIVSSLEARREDLKRDLGDGV